MEATMIEQEAACKRDGVTRYGKFCKCSLPLCFSRNSNGFGELFLFEDNRSGNAQSLVNMKTG